MLSIHSDEHYMKQAYRLAEQAYTDDEVPIGAVVVSGNRIIGKGYNQVERLKDPTAHAEMIAISAACEYLDTKFLDNCTLYITVEPCTMCAGAIHWARLGKIVYGTTEPKFGFQSKELSLLHPKTQIVSGIMEEECRELMQRFFLEKRKK